jgi:chromosome segregation ATPase
MTEEEYQKKIAELEEKVLSLQDELEEAQGETDHAGWDRDDALDRVDEADRSIQQLTEAYKPTVNALESEWVNKFDMSQFADELRQQARPEARTAAKIIEAVIKLREVHV